MRSVYIFFRCGSVYQLSKYQIDYYIPFFSIKFTRYVYYKPYGQYLWLTVAFSESNVLLQDLLLCKKELKIENNYHHCNPINLLQICTVKFQPNFLKQILTIS